MPCPEHSARPWSTGDRRKMPPGWSSTRRRVLDRDGHACRLVLPGCTGRATEVHHTIPGVEIEATLLSACPACHAIVTNAQAKTAQHGHA